MYSDLLWFIFVPRPFEGGCFSQHASMQRILVFYLRLSLQPLIYTTLWYNSDPRKGDLARLPPPVFKSHPMNILEWSVDFYEINLMVYTHKADVYELKI